MLKKIFPLLILFFSFLSTGYSQWWVSGGNLTWPFGDVNVTKGTVNVDSTVNASSVKQSKSLLVLGNATDLLIDNTAYEYSFYRNDIGIDASSIKWDSTYNMMKLHFDNCPIDFGSYDPFPNRTIALADTTAGAGWFTCLCVVNTTTTGGDTSLTWKFYRFDTNIQLTSDNLYKVTFPIAVWLAPGNDAELGYQWDSTY
jgi:hypothetical protein